MRREQSMATYQDGTTRPSFRLALNTLPNGTFITANWHIVPPLNHLHISKGCVERTSICCSMKKKISSIFASHIFLSFHWKWAKFAKSTDSMHVLTFEIECFINGQKYWYSARTHYCHHHRRSFTFSHLYLLLRVPAMNSIQQQKIDLPMCRYIHEQEHIFIQRKHFKTLGHEWAPPTTAVVSGCYHYKYIVRSK